MGIVSAMWSEKMDDLETHEGQDQGAGCHDQGNIGNLRCFGDQHVTLATRRNWRMDTSGFRWRQRRNLQSDQERSSWSGGWQGYGSVTWT